MFAILIECDPSGSLGVSCLNDIHNMTTYLRPRAREVHVFTTREYKHREVFRDVKYHILTDKLKDDVSDVVSRCADAGGQLLVYLTGHGMQMRDHSGDEEDGLDEYILVSKSSKVYRDDDLNSIFLDTDRYRFIGITDTCHSGTMFDLPYTDDNGRITFNRRHHEIRCTNAFTISGCRDSQVSVCDATGGSLTLFLLKDDRISKFLHEDFSFAESLRGDLRAYGQVPCIQLSIKNTKRDGTDEARVDDQKVIIVGRL